jgi:hypothetical protein
MITRASILVCLLAAASVVAAQDPKTESFNVSLSAGYARDLSPAYRQVIRDATEAYRGDLPVYSRFVIDALAAVSKRRDKADPFSHIEFTLRMNSEQPVPRE